MLELRRRGLLLGLLLLVLATWPRSTVALTEKYRLTWRDDPATTMVVAWNQASGADPVLYWDTVDHGMDWAAYAHSTSPARTSTAKGMDNRFVRLTGLAPDTAHYFVIVDDEGPSERMWFKTAPNECAEFSFVAGGDSRNNRGPRQDANVLVSRLRPLFIAFGGDYTDDDTDEEWEDWLDDWQLTRSPDGRMYPIVTTRGNHESNASVTGLFDPPSADVYFAFSFGGTQLRAYTLNSQIVEGGSQATWLDGDLADFGDDHVFRVAQYHKPMRPHTTSKSEGTDEYDAWAQHFFDHRVDLVVECDSHLVKRTYPVRPFTGPGNDEGFLRDDENGTVYVGEGCWGAPLRTANDDKDWTRAMGSFNQVQWVHVTPSALEVRTLITAGSGLVAEVDDADPLALPSGLDVWDPAGGPVVTLPARGAADEDGDGVPDACDPCPVDAPDDSDGDGSCDSDDLCPDSDDRIDTDGDTTPDGCDACPEDELDDSDGDGACDSDDLCPGSDDARDRDADGVPDDCDACPDDATGDSDGDGACDSDDACPGHDDALDVDGDTVADGCDACPGFPDDEDRDGDGAADGCDPCPDDAPDDSDGDGSCNSDDTCPGADDTLDEDADAVPDGCDACPGFDDALGPPLVGPGSSLRLGGTTVSWDPVALATTYALHRGTLPGLALGPRPRPHDHVCLVTSADASVEDLELPEVGFYYLVAASNPCGPAPDGLGRDWTGLERPVPACP
ncbi:MAG: fibronectin type III domain-containing protein [Acidobacteriota bacterium]